MRKSVDETKRELIDHLKETRFGLLNATREFPPSRCDDPFLGTWSIKDLLAHLIGWDSTNRRAIEEIISGSYPDFLQYYDKDWKTYNERLILEYKKPSFDELCSDVENSHQQFIAFITALPAEDLVNGKARSPKNRTVSIANLLRAEAADERVHTMQVITYLQALTV